ncbi:MAG: thermonuclease family protein [Geminicoccaceae bacterium]
MRDGDTRRRRLQADRSLLLDRPKPLRPTRHNLIHSVRYPQRTLSDAPSARQCGHPGRLLRVWGLDAPEVDMPGGSQATAALTALISGQQLSCHQRDIDRYGRIVGQCFLPDGRDITAVMIESGTAQEFCRYSGNHYRTC